jgi:hypothetical protein
VQYVWVEKRNEYWLVMRKTEIQVPDASIKLRCEDNIETDVKVIA